MRIWRYEEFFVSLCNDWGQAPRQSSFNNIYRAWNDALWRCCSRKSCMNNLHLRPDERHPGTLWKCSRRWRPEPLALNYRPKEAMLNGLKFLSKRQLRHMTYLFSVRVACTWGWLLSTETRRIFGYSGGDDSRTDYSRTQSIWRRRYKG